MKKTLNLVSSINSPLPTSLAGECKKATKILNSFLDPGEGVDIIIPASILEKAQGLAIFTVLKAGFVFSGRAGSGLVVARLPDDSWSAPSAIVTGGMGAGGQIGAELTDFVLILNTKEAVKTFSQFGNIQLGGNISIAAGPVGRNAEASGSATFKHISAIYSYSKTRGLFAGVSLEGTIVITRSDANDKLYGEHFTAKQLLNGTVPPPREADSLYRALNNKFKTHGNTGYHRAIQQAQQGDSTLYRNTTMSAPGTLKIPPIRLSITGPGAPRLIEAPPSHINNNINRQQPYTTNLHHHSSTSKQPALHHQSSTSKHHQPYSYTPPESNEYGENLYATPSAPDQPLSPLPQKFDNSSYRDFPSSPTSSVLPRYTSVRSSIGSSYLGPPSPVTLQQLNKPNQFPDHIPYEKPHAVDVPPPSYDGATRMSFNRDLGKPASAPPTPPPKQSSKPLQVKALYTFKGEQTGDLSFGEGDIITIINKSENQNDWWTGRLRGASGSFPANYVQLT